MKKLIHNEKTGRKKKSSTSLPGGNLVDGLPPAHSLTYERKFDIYVKKYSYSWKLDLEPAPGRKLSQDIEIHSENTPKPAKIEKIRKSRKRAQNLMIHQFFDFKYAFSLCWRNK